MPDISCPLCGEKTRRDLRWCLRCGGALAVRKPLPTSPVPTGMPSDIESKTKTIACSNCLRPVPRGQAYCPNCGGSMKRWRRLIPLFAVLIILGILGGGGYYFAGHLKSLYSDIKEMTKGVFSTADSTSEPEKSKPATKTETTTPQWENCVEGDCINGTGTYHFPNGDKYVGQFKNGKLDGRGTYTFTQGHQYVGNFKENNFHGVGTMVYRNGNRKQGRWENGVYVSP